MESLRAFIAIEMPVFVVEAIRRSQKLLQRDGVRLRWVRPENVHLTLRFLGDVSTADIPAVQAAMQRSVSFKQPFSLGVSGIGAFPGLNRPKVLWLGLNGQKDLLDELYQTLSVNLSEQGIPFEKRPFKGHLTIGRVKEQLDCAILKAALQQQASVETEAFQVEQICLFKSDLTPRGAVYTPLKRIRIGD